MPPTKVKAARASYEGTGWCNVFRSGLKLWYRSRASGNKAVSGSTIEELKQKLNKMNITLVKRPLLHPAVDAGMARVSAKASNAAANSEVKSNAKSKAKARPRRKRKFNRLGAHPEASIKSEMPKRKLAGKQSLEEPQVRINKSCCGICFRVSGFDLYPPCQCPGGRLRELAEAE